MSETPAKADAEATRGLPASLPYRFGDYELEAEIARGAMGVVFRARQLSLERTVALKLVLASWLASEDQEQRFLTEAKASAGLHHPSIVPVHEIGEHAGQHFISFAFIQGQSLAALIEEGPLGAREAATLMKEIAAAIQYAHDQGILHRDIKPANILLDEESHAWITDFGLAKLEGDSTRITATGQTVGTPSYMSPEQAAGEVIGIGPATDVYSLGATLYTCLAGRPPFLAPSAMATMHLVQERDPIPLGTLNPAVPRDLQTICMSCLAKSPRHRYASAGSLANDLGRFLEGESILARPVSLLEQLGRRLRRHPRTAGLLALLFAIICGSAITVLTQWRRAVDALEAQKSAEVQRIESSVEALGLAAPEAFLALAEQLDLDDPRVLGRLQDIVRDEQIDERLRFRSRLAALPRHPRESVDLAREVGHLLDDPREFRLGVESIRAALPEVDRVTREEILAVFAEGSTDPLGSDGKRFRCALALYACAPDHPAWRAQVEPMARLLTRTSPFQLPSYAALLSPWPAELVAELARLFVDGDERERQASANLLARAASSYPEQLVALLPKADNDQHRILLEALRGETDLITRSMREYLARPRPRSRASEQALPPAPAAEAIRKNFRMAHGILEPSFAHCVDMPLAEFKETCEALRPFDYTPVKVRPFRNGADTSVSAIFLRDGREWEIDWDAQDLPELGSVDLGEPAWIPIDSASYVVRGTSARDQEHDLVVWSEPLEPTRAWVLNGAQTARELYASSGDLIDREFHPISLQISINTSGAYLVDTLWHQVEKRAAPEIVTGLSESQIATFSSTELSQIEIDVTARDPEHQVCSGLWTPDRAFESRVIWEKSPDEHQRAARELTDLGFTPIATSVSWNDSIARGSAVSTWQRPWIPAEERIAEDRRRARAAATLAGQGHLEEVVTLLGKSRDPSVRFQLALELANLELAPARILEELERRTDDGERFALLLALGQMPLRRFDDEHLGRWMKTLHRLASRDPHAGIHSLSRWILAKHGEDSSPEPPVAEEARQWSVHPEAHTLVRIEAPVQFVMGAASWVRGRRAAEAPHLHLIEHAFEIASTEVTVAQVERFREEQPMWSQPNRQRDPNEATEFSTWFEAVAYCRWLSEVAGMPEAEMCYPPLSEIGPGMVLAEDHLERSGYRLPTEAEWEYACRAGARTLYFFGSDTRLLAAFANSRGPHDSGATERQVRPVARRLPNDFGLFDMHGNVQEWCHDAFVDHLMLGRLAARITGDSRASLKDEPYRNLRGGWYDSSPLTSGCASRRRARAETRSRGIGFRIARTLR